MKSKIQIRSPKEMIHFVIALLLIAIPIYLLSYCLKMRQEGFGLFGDHSKEWEGFQNMIGKKKLPDLPSGVASDVKSTLDSSGDFKGSPNEDLLEQLNPKMPIHKVDGLSKKPDEKNKILNKSIKKQIEGKQNVQNGIQKGGVKEMPTFQSQKIKPGMGYIPLKKDLFANRISQMSNKCGFFSDQCPSGYETVSSFGIQGLPSGMTLQCGNLSSDSKSGKFIAEIQNGSIKSVNVINGGSGYDKNKSYTVKVNGGGGSNASLEAIMDDKGKVQVINVLNGGSGYTSTPQIILQNGDGTGMGSSCQFCCPSA
jgi:hypothetical protein